MNSKLVSILVPTRHRPHGIQRIVDSIVETASDISRIELLLRLDDDDPKTKEFLLDGIKSPPELQIKIVEGSRYLEVNRVGYHNLHTFYCELAQISKGLFLFVFNDDCIFVNRGWDDSLQTYANSICIVNPKWHNYTPGFITFPIIHRKIFEWTGTLGNCCTIDRWFTRVAGELNIQRNAVEPNPVIEMSHIGDIERSSKGCTNGDFPSDHMLEGYTSEPQINPNESEVVEYINIVKNKLELEDTLLVSVLIPTRERLPDLIECIESLNATCAFPSDTEILLGIDSDDTTTINHDFSFSKIPVIKYLDTRPDMGYTNIHLVYNRLYEASKGKFVFIYNDDCIMKTSEWDEIIKYIPDEYSIIRTEIDLTSSPGILFPIVRKQLIGKNKLSSNRELDADFTQMAQTHPDIVYSSTITINHSKGLDHII